MLGSSSDHHDGGFINTLKKDLWKGWNPFSISSLILKISH